MKKEVYMCRKCAEELIQQGKAKLGSSVKEKQTCSRCERRRFVYNVKIDESDFAESAEKVYVIKFYLPSGIVQYVADGTYSSIFGKKEHSTTVSIEDAHKYATSASAKASMTKLLKSYDNLSSDYEIVEVDR